ncbi:MAG: DUF2961 domain-containing protein [Ilumatobacteraceae bacterium]
MRGARACGRRRRVLHASFRRENPTTIRQDFTIADGFTGPGRSVGCNVGVRVASEPAWFSWYDEGEVKMYLDDDALPTWCGTMTSGRRSTPGGSWPATAGPVWAMVPSSGSPCASAWTTTARRRSSCAGMCKGCRASTSTSTRRRLTSPGSRTSTRHRSN